MKSKFPIGVFDSGIGGLTVACAINKLLPQEQLIYFGDTAHLPYGDKSTAAIQAYTIKVCDVLLKQHVKVIVIACNSASSSAYDLAKAYVGSRAIVINVIDPLIKYVSENFESVRIGLIGTKRTVHSNVYKSKIDLLNKNIDLVSLSTPLLAPMIEEGFYENKISKHIVSEYLNHLTLKGINSLILGCTHYPLIKDEINTFYQGKINVLDSSEIIANHLVDVLKENNLLSHSLERQHEFFVSDFTLSFQKSTEQFFGQSVVLQLYKLWE